MLIEMTFGDLPTGQHFYHGSALEREHYYKSSATEATNQPGTVFTVPAGEKVMVDPGTVPGLLKYKAVLVRDGGFIRLFVFLCQGQYEGQVAGGLPSISLDYWEHDIIKAAKAVLVRGSARFACNNPIVAEWKEDASQQYPVPDKEGYVLDALEGIWRMLDDGSIIDARYFYRVGGDA